MKTHICSWGDVKLSARSRVFTHHPLTTLVQTVRELAKESSAKNKAKTKTYNSEDSLVVTHPTTNSPACGLSTAERTGSPVFHTLWSYVLVDLWERIIERREFEVLPYNSRLPRLQNLQRPLKHLLLCPQSDLGIDPRFHILAHPIALRQERRCGCRPR
jgi:hypothetical protein